MLCLYGLSGLKLSLFHCLSNCCLQNGSHFVSASTNFVPYYRQVSNTSRTKSQHLKDSRTVLRLSLPNPWSQMLSRDWRCSWSSADRRCSNYIWVIDNFIAAAYIRGFMVIKSNFGLAELWDCFPWHQCTLDISWLLCVTIMVVENMMPSQHHAISKTNAEWIVATMSSELYYIRYKWNYNCLEDVGSFCYLLLVGS